MDILGGEVAVLTMHPMCLCASSECDGLCLYRRLIPIFQKDLEKFKTQIEIAIYFFVKVAMANCPEDEIGFFSSCPNCERQPVHKPPHRTRVYWIFAALAHTGSFLLTLLLFDVSVKSKVLFERPVQSSPIEHDKNLVGTFACKYIRTMIGSKIRRLKTIAPINNHASYKIESLTPGDWNAELFFGEPSYDSDIAWNKLIQREKSTAQMHCYDMLI